MISLFVLSIASSNIGNIYFFNKKKDKEFEEEYEDRQDNLLCKFVTDGSGRKIGESVTIDDDVLIIKFKERFLGVPLKHVEDNGKTLLVKGLVDFDKAYELGEKWRNNSFQSFEEDFEEKKD